MLLYYTTLHYNILYYTTLYHTIPHHTILYYTIYGPGPCSAGRVPKSRSAQLASGGDEVWVGRF